MTAYVILNEQHSLLDEQKVILDTTFGDNWRILSVPSVGWTKSEQRDILATLHGPVVFASPVPLLLALASRWTSSRVFLFHNDRRSKKELPNGKVIYTVATTGWELLEI